MADAPQMVDLGYTPAELKARNKENATCGPSGMDDPYPWGLSITLDRSCLDKLGIDKLPDVGGEWHFMAVAKVTSVNQSATMQSDDTRVGLQITMMQVILQESADEDGGEKETPKVEAQETKGRMLGY